jgi:hypothetical protein
MERGSYGTSRQNKTKQSSEDGRARAKGDKHEDKNPPDTAKTEISPAAAHKEKNMNETKEPLPDCLDKRNTRASTGKDRASKKNRGGHKKMKNILVCTIFIIFWLIRNIFPAVLAATLTTYFMMRSFLLRMEKMNRERPTAESTEPTEN